MRQGQGSDASKMGLDKRLSIFAQARIELGSYFWVTVSTLGGTARTHSNPLLVISEDNDRVWLHHMN